MQRSLLKWNEAVGTFLRLSDDVRIHDEAPAVHAIRGAAGIGIL